MKCPPGAEDDTAADGAADLQVVAQVLEQTPLVEGAVVVLLRTHRVLAV